jgi:hypothetical protein
MNEELESIKKNLPEKGNELIPTFLSRKKKDVFFYRK